MSTTLNSKKAARQIDDLLLAKAQVIGEVIRSAAVLLTPVDTGNLRGSNDYKVIESAESVQVRLFNTADYASYVVLGTGIHTDEPGANKKGWVYPVGDPNNPDFVFTRGQKPQDFLTPAVTSNIPEIKRILKR